MNILESGKYLKNLRLSRNLTIRQVETYAKVSNSYLSQLENGKGGKPSPEILLKLAPVYKIAVEELMEKIWGVEWKNFKYNNFEEYLETVLDEDSKNEDIQDYHNIKSERDRKDYHDMKNIAYPSKIKDSNAEYDIAIAIAKNKNISPEKLEKILDAL